ncbi:MAG: FHA domain-containing protein [Chloroflexota bacterium]|nr:FHA domain-containing protein [Chloroflexota bacterium]
MPAQGPRQLGPYAALQLHPGASRDLVIEAYWALVEQQKQRVRPSPDAASRIGELNAAYAILVSDTARAAYDEQYGLMELRAPQIRLVNRGFPLLLGITSIKAVSDHRDLYHLLRIAPDADPVVVDAAVAVLSRQASSFAIEDVFLRGLIAEAHHTLSDPGLRAEYDGALAGHRPAPSAASPARAEAPEEIDHDPGILTAIAMDLAHVARLLSRRARPQRPKPAVAGGEGNADIAIEEPHRVPPALAGAARAAAPKELDDDPGILPAIAMDVGHAARLLWRRARAQRCNLLPPLKPKTYDLKPRHPASGVTSARPSKRAAREGAEDLLIEAEHARLMTLREPDRSHALANGIGNGSAATGQTALGELLFLDGPRAGDSVPLGAEAVTIGSSYSSDIVLHDEGGGGQTQPEHARIWLHGDHFVLRQIDGADTTVAGQPLTLPTVILDDGDEISIGPHHMRLIHRPT